MKKKSVLIVSISMVLVAVLALTTASFAWFTTSMNPSVGYLNVQVTSSNALLVGALAKGKNKKTEIAFKTVMDTTTLKASEGAEIPAFDLTTSANTKMLSNITPKTLTADAPKKVDKNVTGGIDFSRLTKGNSEVPDFTQADVYTDATNTGLDAGNKAIPQDYVKFDLYFQANFTANADVRVALAMKDVDASGVKASKVTPMVYTDETKTAVKELTLDDAKAAKNFSYYIAKTLRFGFVASEVKVNEADGVIQTPAAGDFKAPVVFEPDATGFDADFKVDETTNIDAAKKYETDKAVATAGDELLDQLYLFTMPNNSIYKLTVYIWIEGNDPQTVNAVSGGIFNTALNFMGTQEPAKPVAP